MHHFDVQNSPLGQIDPGVATGAEPPAGVSLPVFYFVAVAAGVTVWFLTSMLEGAKRRK